MISFAGGKKQEEVESNFSQPKWGGKQVASIGEAIESFRQKIASYGLGAPDVVDDGEIHRFDVPDKERGNSNGWYVFFSDHIPAGAFGAWDQDISERWCSKANYELSNEELAEIQRRIEAARARQKAIRMQEADEAAAKAVSILNSCPDALNDHPYLQRKKVKAFGLKLGEGNQLLVPLFDVNKQIRGFERIPAEPGKNKTVLKGTYPVGIFGFINGNTDTVYVVEGYATGASVHMATGYAVAVARNAGNILPAARAVLQLFPMRNIVIAGDNDQWTKRRDGTPWNVGVEKAKAAGAELGLSVVIPDFRDCSTQPTDFNDLHCLEDLKEVKRQLRPDTFELQSFDEILRMDFEERPVIEGLLDEGENLMIIGPSNIGKSLLMLQLACSIAGEIGDTPGALFDRFAVPRRRKVLFLQSENSAKATKKRLVKMLQGAPEMATALANLETPVIPGKDGRCHGPVNSAFYDRACAMIRKSRADVVVIDPLISFHDCDENDNVAMRSALDRFNDLANDMGVSLIIVHHTGKDPERGGRGASAIKDWYDNALILTHAQAAEGQTVIKVIHDKSRNYRVQPAFYLERNEHLVHHQVEDPEAYLVVSAIYNAGGVIYSETALIEAIEMETEAIRSRTYWQNAIKRAMRMKIIRKDGEGKKISFTVAQENEVQNTSV